MENPKCWWLLTDHLTYNSPLLSRIITVIFMSALVCRHYFAPNRISNFECIWPRYSWYIKLIGKTPAIRYWTQLESRNHCGIKECQIFLPTWFRKKLDEGNAVVPVKIDARKQERLESLRNSLKQKLLQQRVKQKMRDDEYQVKVEAGDLHYYNSKYR